MSLNVAASQTNGETNQAIGSRARFLYLPETNWGQAAAATATRNLRILPGSGIDQNVAVYRSKQLRGDRMHNPPVRGSQDPDFMMPFELSPNGWNMMLYQLLGGSVTTTGPTGTLTDATTLPSATPSASGGFIATGNYFYKYTYINGAGETLTSAASTSTAVTGPSGSVAITATVSVNATGYNFYRSTTSGGTYNLIGSSNTNTFTDTLTIPNGPQPPSSNSTGIYYQHSFIGATTTAMPTGFTLEESFLDLSTPVYLSLFGCKADKMNINFRVDAIPEGQFTGNGRDFEPIQTFTGSAPTQATEAPYTGAYVALYEGATNDAAPGIPTGSPLGICNDLSLSIDNAYYAKRGFVLGDVHRQNLKPGTRMVTANGKFMFQDLSLYNKAINATNTALKIVCVSSTYMHIFDMPSFQFIPNKSAPRPTDDGPLEISLNGEALPDSGIGSDIKVTIRTAETNITT